MNHADVQSHLADYLEGDLPISKRALFDAHLDRCTECSQEVEEMRSTVSLLRGMPDPEPPATLAADVMRRIRRGEAEPGFFDRVAMWVDELTTPRVMAPVAAFAAGMAVVLVSGLVDVRMPGLAPEQGHFAESAPEAAEVQVAATEVRRPIAPPRMDPADTGVREFPLMTMPAQEPRVVAQAGPQSPDRMANFVAAQSANTNLGSEIDPETRRQQALDRRLETALRDPGALVRELAAYDPVELELWTNLLVARAAERGDAAQVLAALEASEESSALATAFAQALSAREAVGAE